MEMTPKVQGGTMKDEGGDGCSGIGRRPRLPSRVVRVGPISAARRPLHPSSFRLDPFL
jgi:hypothetical protein